MFRHLTIAALRNIAANRLQSAIAIIGLCIGLTVALLMSLVIRNQTSFDTFIPGYERTYMVLSDVHINGLSDREKMYTDEKVASLFKLNLPEVESATRLMRDEEKHTFERGVVLGEEAFYWADPGMADVLPMPALYGDFAVALQRPDGIVLPLSSARKYFGRDNVVGQSIELDGHPMTVRAVTADFPPGNTQFKSGIFVSSLAAFSAFFKKDFYAIQTYVRLKPGASLAGIQAKIPSAVIAHIKRKNFGPDDSMAMPLLRLDRINLDESLNPGVTTKLAIGAVAGFLILFIAVINFINLLTARAARRTLEVGMRKVCGASRSNLIAQFLGESFVAVLVAACAATALIEMLLPYTNAFLNSAAVFDYWRNPSLLLWLALVVAVLSLLAGAYPAFILAGFRPAGVLKGWIAKNGFGDWIRNGLVTLQFAILIGLVIATGVVFQQRSFGMREALRVDTDQILIIRLTGEMPPGHPPATACLTALKIELRKLTGVQGAYCSGHEFLESAGAAIYKDNKGVLQSMNIVGLDWGLFALYGIKPVAGSLATLSGDFDPNVKAAVLNEAAIKQLGFATPEAAIGKKAGPVEKVTAVVPDFALSSVEKSVEPTAYQGSFFRGPNKLVHLKLDGQHIPETLAAIDRIWKATGHGETMDRFFLDEHMQQVYLSVLRQGQFFSISAGIAAFLACLGLLGLSISTAERRTKEIGIRKAMGAGSGDVTRLLLWQFTRPVLWASLIAWPVTWYAMNKWLAGFAYHIELAPWLFVGATFVAAVVALLTVAIQSTLLARAIPATSLRYE